MAYPVSSGGPQYSGNFIPEIWSGKLIENFYDATVLSAISNTDYEGSIKSYGDTVNIRTTPTVSIKTYVKGQTLETETPDQPKIQLVIDKGDYFSVTEDDIDRIQSDINLMDTWTKDASEGMKIKIDQLVLSDILTGIVPERRNDRYKDWSNKGNNAGRISRNIKLGSISDGVGPRILNNSNVLDLLIDINTVLDEANAPMTGRYVVIPSKMAGFIKKSDLKDASLTGDGSTPLRNGKIGMVDNLMLYVSHNLKRTSLGAATRGNTGTHGAGGIGNIDGAVECFHLVAGHKMAFTFASQMTEMETIRSERTFSNIIRGLQVYGYKVCKPEALAEVVVTFADWAVNEQRF